MCTETGVVVAVAIAAAVVVIFSFCSVSDFTHIYNKNDNFESLKANYNGCWQCIMIQIPNV